MGQLTQTTTELQAIVDNSDAANVGKTSLTDGSDTTAVAFKKSGFYSLQGSSANAPSTDRAVLISAVRNTAATGEIRYGQIAITESNGLWWNRDDGGSLGTWYAAVSTTGTQTLTNKTLTSPVLTTPQINDSASDHQYIFAGSNLVADRTVTLPLLASNDTFVFEAHTQTLTNKTLTSPVFNTGVSGTAVLDADDFTGASATTLATSESIKAYVDSQVGSFDTLSEVLAAGNTTGSTDIEVTAAQKVQFRDTGIYINSSADGQLDIVADTEIQIAATTIDINGAINASGEIIAASLDISGDIDVDGTTNLDVVDIDGAVDFASTTAHAGNATFADNAKVILGAGSDLQIFHDGSNSYIKDVGAGDLRIWADSPNISTASGNKIFFGNNGSAELYTSGGALRLATTASGIDVTGTVTASSTLTAQKLVSTNGVLELDDNGTHNGIINSPASLFINIDSDNGATGEDFVIGKDRTGTSGGTELFRVQEDGLVGIGTSSPSSYPVAPNLVVNAGTNGGITIKTGSTNYGGVYFADGTTGDEQYRGFIQYNHDYAGSTDSLLFGAAGTERLRIDANGKMLIGDTASHTSDLLQIETPASGGGHGIQIRRNDSNTDQTVGSITFGNNTATDLASISAKTDGATDNGALLFNTSVSGGANTERMRIDAGGSVLIGKTTPADLHNTWNHIIIGEKGAIISENGAGGIDGITLSDNAYIDADTGTYAYQTAAAASLITQSGGVTTFSNAASGSAGWTLTPVPRMTISAAGQLFLNVTAEVAAGYIASIKCAAGTGGVIIQNSSTAGVPLSFRDTSASQIGSVSTTNTATAYNTSSDQRLKENIADADDAGSKVDSIQVRKFDWKADGSHQDYGMVAQELLEVAPEAVHQPEDPEEMMGVDYSKLVPMMLKEIQSLRARIAALES